MRILYHHRTLADGAEGIHIAEMVHAFRALGHEVRVLGAQGEAGRGEDAGFAARVKTALPPPAFELAALAYNLPEYLATRRAIRAFRPDVVYLRHARFGGGATLATRHAHVPLVTEVNCLFAEDLYNHYEPLTFRRVARRLERWALESADVVLAVSSPLAERVREAANVQAVVLPNGADPARFDPARFASARVDTVLRASGHAHSGAAGPVIGWTGVLRAWHGLELLVEAVAQVDGVTLLLVGDGPARAEVEARAASRGIGDRVVITGRVGHDEVAAHVAAMDVCVVADERTGVASPMKLLEYMAMARAVVAPDLPNIRDLVRSGVDGVLFTPGDSGALAEAIRALAGDTAMRERLGQAARQRVVTELNWGANARRVLELIARARPHP